MSIIINDKTKCTGCYTCFSICPKKIIEMESDEEGFKYPAIDEAKCINCGLCDKACPIITQKTNSGNEVMGFAAKAKDNNIRFNSSSGGIFYLIASYVIANDGVVFGAALNEDCSVNHIYIESKDDIKRLQRSKYVQSEIGDSYIRAKKFLDVGRLVMFTGTPCQIAGLYSFLSREYDNLLTQDIACMGVPSPMAWKKYKEFIGYQEKATVQNVNYRDKTTGWKDYSIRISLDNGVDRIVNHNENIYMQDFLLKYDLRPSCYDCQFKGIQRNSDITLADFWGIEHIIPEFFDDYGVSLIMIHTKRGNEIFKQISGHIIYKETDLFQAAKYNTAIIESVSLPNERKVFFKKLKNKSYISAHKAAKRKHFFNAIKMKIFINKQ